MAEDYKKKVKDKEAEFSGLIKRMDADRDLLNLVKYEMKDIAGNKVPNIVNVTLNRPAVFAANVISALGSTSEQRVVESENKNLDTAYIENFQRAAFGGANARLRAQGRFQLNPFFDFQACIRGRAAARCIFQMVNDVLVPDIVGWDTRYVTYEMGAEGLNWGAYKTTRQKDVIEAEYGEELAHFRMSVLGKSTEVMDVWDTEHNEVWVTGKKILEQEHPFGFCPVAIQVVSLGSMLADTDSLEHQGESIFFLIRHVIPELNRLLSIMQTLNLTSVKPPIQERAKDGRTTTPRDYEEVTGMGSSSVVDAEGGITRIDFGDAQRSANIAYGMMDKAMQEGSLSSFDLGTFTQPMSAIALIEIGEGRDQIFLPRLAAKELLNVQLAEMFTAQVLQIGGSVELGTKGHKRTFETSKLEGEYETTYKYFVKSPAIDAGRFSVAAAAGNLIPDKAKRREILQREDPDGDERQLRWEEAERISPAIKINRIIKDLVEMDEDFEAELLSAEMGVNLKQMLAGEVAQQPKPEPEEEPKQVVPMFGGGAGGAGGARRPRAISGEEEG